MGRATVGVRCAFDPNCVELTGDAPKVRSYPTPLWTELSGPLGLHINVSKVLIFAVRVQCMERVFFRLMCKRSRMFFVQSE